MAELPGRDRRPDEVPVAEFAATALLRGQSLMVTLPAVLARLADGFEARAALAVQCPNPGQLEVLGSHPQQAASDPALLAAVSALCRENDELAETGGSAQRMLTGRGRAGGGPFSALLTFPEPVAGQPRCCIVLTGTAPGWSPAAVSAARAVTTIMAAQLRRACEATEQAERQALHESRFRQLAEVAPVGIAQTDTAGRIVFVNARWCELTGLNASDVVGGTWTRAVHPADVRRVERERQYAFEHRAELRTDCRLRPSGGEDIWVHAAVTAITGPDGRAAGGLAALTNVSGRKREERERAGLLAAEQQARRSLADQTQRLQSLLAAAIPGVLFVDEHGTILELNKSFCALFGLAEDPAEFSGTPVADLVRRIMTVFADPGEFVRRTDAAFRRRQPASGERMTCTDGRTLEGDYWPVFVDGDYRGDLWLAWDMSEQAELARQRERIIEADLAARELAELARQQLERQNARLQEAAAEKTKYLAAFSHELGTPLATIVSFAELIRAAGHGISADVEDFLNIIERNAEQLAHMIGELSLLGRIEAGVLPLELAPVSVPELIGQEVASASASAGRQRIRIDGRAGDGPPVHGDEHGLRQVLANLIGNAVKFSRPDGLVRVSGSCDGEWWHITVEDSGIGIPAGELGRIFDRFSRGSNARIEGLPGTGLGLSIVKAITELHGGRVQASCPAGGPTTFDVSLPPQR